LVNVDIIQDVQILKCWHWAYDPIFLHTSMLAANIMDPAFVVKNDSRHHAPSIL